MTSWSEGYVADIAYSIGYYREMAPDHLAFAALSVGKSAGCAAKPKRVLELGFGMGVGFVIGAASQPDTFFEGCDFNPEHVSHTQRLAEAAGLENLSIREASFQELAAEAHEGQHDLDLIQLHGILTWVSEDAHRAIVEIARKRLKPGGLLYVSYNCMPGWAAMVPVQRLMREHSRNTSGSSLHKSAQAIDAVKKLVASNARYFQSNPSVSPRVDKLGSMQASYIAHEYLNENWFIFHFADVAAMMGEAKLSFLASASLAENMDGVCVPPELRDSVAEITDPIWKETLRDFASNKQFRRDIFSRGITDLNKIENMTSLHSLSFTLAMPRSAVTLKLPSPLGEVEAKPEIYDPLADMLDGRIVSFGEIVTTEALRSFGFGSALQALAMMVHAGQVLPILNEPNSDFGPSQRLNKVLIDYAGRGRVYNFLAAPIARTAIPVTSLDMLALSVVVIGNSDDANAIVEFIVESMNKFGSKPVRKDGKPVETLEEMREVITGEVGKFVQEKLPLFRRLGCI